MEANIHSCMHSFIQAVVLSIRFDSYRAYRTSAAEPHRAGLREAGRLELDFCGMVASSIAVAFLQRGIQRARGLRDYRVGG